MADNMWIWVWLGVTAVSLIIEFIVMDMVTVWFVAGGIVSMILAAARVPVNVQITVFIVLSLVLLLSLRKLSLKYLFRNSNEKTNMDLNIGKVLVLREKITTTQNGTIRLNGVDWTAITDEGKSINEGEMVEIVSLLGNRFVVKKHVIKKEIRADERQDVVATDIAVANEKQPAKTNAKKESTVSATKSTTTKSATTKSAGTKSATAKSAGNKTAGSTK